METIIEILIDKSGSMGFMNKKNNSENEYLLTDGSTRMSLIKKILIKDITPIIDHANKILIRTFRVSRNQGGEDFTDVELVYEGGFKKDVICQKIQELPDPPPGGTPITAAVIKAVDNLKEYNNHDRSIILLTDGEENGGGDYKKAIHNAISIDGIPCRVFIVGIDQAEQAIEQSKEIAKISKGKYINVTKQDYDSDIVSSVLAPIKSAILSHGVTNRADNQFSSQDQKEAITSSKSEESEKLSSSIESGDFPKPVQDDISDDLQKLINQETKLNEVVNNHSTALTLISKQLEGDS